MRPAGWSVLGQRELRTAIEIPKVSAQFLREEDHGLQIMGFEEESCVIRRIGTRPALNIFRNTTNNPCEKDTAMNLRQRSISIPKNLGILILSIWLIAIGAIPLLGLGSVFLTMAVHILAIIAGVLLLIDRR